MQLDGRAGVVQPDEKLFDQEPVVKYDDALRRQSSGPLIGQIGIVDRRDAHVVAILEHSSQLQSRYDSASGNNQGGVAKIDEADLSALVDAPSPPQLGGQTGLAPVRNPRVARGGHACIVERVRLQALFEGWPIGVGRVHNCPRRNLT